MYAITLQQQGKHYIHSHNNKAITHKQYQYNKAINIRYTHTCNIRTLTKDDKDRNNNTPAKSQKIRNENTKSRPPYLVFFPFRFEGATRITLYSLMVSFM